MTYVVGALGSHLVKPKAFGGRSAKNAGRREPRGMRHAVDLDSGDPACGTAVSLRVFDDEPWAPEGEWCPTCESLVPFDV